MISRALPRRTLTAIVVSALVSVALSTVSAAALPTAGATSVATPLATPSLTPTPTATTVPSRFTTVGVPTVSGAATVGVTLTATPGTWSPAPTSFSYQWLRDAVAITAATGATYVPVEADVGRAVTVRVTAVRAGYTSASATSAAKSIGRAFTSAPVPAISGTVAVGQTLTASHTAWTPSPVTVTYQWYRGSAAISGATGKTYKLVATDAGMAVSVRAKGVKDTYTTVTRSSVAVSVPKVLTVPSTVALSGTATVGSTLTASPGTWAPSPVTLTYQWLRDGVSISKATAKSYTLVAQDAGTKLSVRVTGSKSGYTTVSRTTPTVDAKWGFTSSPTPTFSGTVSAGRVLTASVGTWAPTPAKLAYQWRVDGAVVAGASASTWRVPEWAAGRSVTVTVTATKSGYLTVTRTSAKRTASWSLGDTLYPATPMRAGTYLTSPNGIHRLTVQGDGNVVLSKNGVAQRSTRTTGVAAPVLLLQEDGTLAVYSGDDTPVWQAGTTGYAVHGLNLDDSGNLRLIEVDGVVGWDGTKLPVFSDSTAATATVPGRYGWAYPIRPSATMTTYSGHGGDDFAAPTGTPVYAMRGGKATVQEIWITSGCPAWAPNNTRQKQVLVESVIDGKKFVLTYAHLSAFSVTTGATVRAGQKIGEVGSTGCSTGPHLHLDIKINGVPKLMFPRDVLGSASY